MPAPPKGDVGLCERPLKCLKAQGILVDVISYGKGRIGINAVPSPHLDCIRNEDKDS